jgi:hypothetical protein
VPKPKRSLKQPDAARHAGGIKSSCKAELAAARMDAKLNELDKWNEQVTEALGHSARSYIVSRHPRLCLHCEAGPSCVMFLGVGKSGWRPRWCKS